MPFHIGQRGVVIIVLDAITTAIALGLVLLRLYVRSRILHSLHWDDLFIVFALASHSSDMQTARIDTPANTHLLQLTALVAFGFYMTSVHYGVGQHVINLSPGQLVQAGKYLIVGEFPVAVSTAFSKIAICLFLSRFFMTFPLWTRILRFTIAFIATTTVSWFVANFFKCHPFRKDWNPTIEGTCWTDNQQNAINYFQGCRSAMPLVQVSGG